MNAGHGGKSGRDGAIEEIALDYAFALKISKKIWYPPLKKQKQLLRNDYKSPNGIYKKINLLNKGGYNDK